MVVTFNIRALGGQISFLQSVSTLGYCIFPLFIAGVVLKLLEMMGFKHILVKILIMMLGVAASARKRWTQQNGPSDPFRDSCRRMERCGWRDSSISLPHEMKELYKSIAYAIHGPGTVCEWFLSSGCPSGVAGSTFHLETNP